MNLKLELKNKIDEVNSTIKNSSLIDNSKANDFEVISKKIDDFKVYLPLIGNFNAGKSSILNALFEEDEFLPTNIVPETAIATEIIYSKDERVEAFDFKDNKKIATFKSLDELKDRDISNYGYLKLYKDSKFLSQNSDIIFVDMPGLDSNIKRHNYQILSYIGKDVVSFIAVVDIDDGGLKGSLLSFLNEINRYKLNFFTVLNKIDKKPPSEVEKIKRNVEAQISRYSSNPFVGLVSTFDNKIDDFKKIPSLIDKDSYIKNIFIPKILSNIETIVKDLEVRKSAIEMDTSEIDDKIRSFMDGIYEFDKRLRYEKQLIDKKFSEDVLDNIKYDIRLALEQNIDRLIRALKTSDESFQLTINEIIRPVIVSSLNKYSEEAFNISIKNLDVAQNDIFEDIKSGLKQTKSTIDTVTDTMKKASTIINIPVVDSILKFILTKLNPIINVISIAIDIISSIFGKSEAEKEREEYEKLRRNIRNQIIPEIIVNIEPSIRNILNETKENFFKELENSINDQKEQLIASLERAKEEKEKYKNEIKSKIEEFDNTIESLNNIYKDIELKYS